MKQVSPPPHESGICPTKPVATLLCGNTFSGRKALRVYSRLGRETLPRALSHRPYLRLQHA
jgi:hypothetical protein